MAFVRERISEADWLKYGLKEIDHWDWNFVQYNANLCYWVVDKERNIYLRAGFSDLRDYDGTTSWFFYWHGELVRFEKEAIAFEQTPPFVHARLYDFSIPEPIIHLKEAMCADLREAYLAKYAFLATYGNPIVRLDIEI